MAEPMQDPASPLSHETPRMGRRSTWILFLRLRAGKRTLRPLGVGPSILCVTVEVYREALTRVFRLSSRNTKLPWRSWLGQAKLKQCTQRKVCINWFDYSLRSGWMCRLQ
jgi:hypothetical protein